MNPSQSDADERRNEARPESTARGIAAVREVLASMHRDGPPRGIRAVASRDDPVSRGDIRMVAPLPWVGGRKRLAIVRRVDPDREIADMMLVHTCPELATDSDAVLEDSDSGVPYPLVVECYVRGPVWLLQLGEKIGVLAEQELGTIGRAVVDGNPAVDGVYAGLPLAGPADPRWSFKEQEVGEWQAISNDCAAALLAGDDPWTLEPAQFPPYAHEDSGGAESDSTASPPVLLRLEEVIHLDSTRPTALNLQDFDPTSLDLESWVQSLGRDVGLDAFKALQPILHKALSQQESSLLQKAA